MPTESLQVEAVGDTLADAKWKAADKARKALNDHVYLDERDMPGSVAWRLTSVSGHVSPLPSGGVVASCTFERKLGERGLR